MSDPDRLGLMLQPHTPIDDDLLGAFEADCKDALTRPDDGAPTRVVMKYFGKTIVRLRNAEAALRRAHPYAGCGDTISRDNAGYCFICAVLSGAEPPPPQPPR